MGKVISIANLKKSYQGDKIIDDISFTINKGDFVVLFGPNGCGKSTLLKIILGLEKYDSGAIEYFINHNEMSPLFQNYSEFLFPWLNGYENIVFPLKKRGLSKTLERDMVESIIDEFDLKEYKKAFFLYPDKMSGGQKQAISLIRALVTKPKILLLDEPFSALDQKNKIKISQAIKKIWLKRELAALMVSHDLNEAVYCANRILILTAKPAKIYKEMKIDTGFKENIYESEKSNEFIVYKKELIDYLMRVIN